MTSEAMPAAAGARPDQERPIDAREAQFLATEHWSLLATRSMSWNESFSRTAMFLSSLSAATVALALVGPATAFGEAFTTFALIVLSIVLFLGATTFVRLVQINNEDLYWAAGMNQLRGAYVRLVPGIEAEFFAGWTLDSPGISRTYGAIDVISGPAPLHLLVTTPAVVSVISSAVAGIMVGLIAIQASMSLTGAIGAGAVALAGGIVLSLAYAVRQSRNYIARMADAARAAKTVD